MCKQRLSHSKREEKLPSLQIPKVLIRFKQFISSVLWKKEIRFNHQYIAEVEECTLQTTRKLLSQERRCCCYKQTSSTAHVEKQRKFLCFECNLINFPQINSIIFDVHRCDTRQISGIQMRIDIVSMVFVVNLKCNERRALKSIDQSQKWVV